MQTEFILIPAILMAILTFIAWIYLFAIRIPAIEKYNIDLKQVKTRALDSMLSERAQTASNHLLNLFEVPVLFYVLSIFIYITNSADNVFIYCSFSYVTLRILHTIIHLSYNNVLHRFAVYLLSSLILWFMWLKFAVIIFQQALS